LNPARQRRLLRRLLKGPLVHGYNTNVWTPARIAKAIGRWKRKDRSRVKTRCAARAIRGHRHEWRHAG
jgi:hypothetical protein